MDTPKFSAYPWSRLPRRSLREVLDETSIAQWIAAYELPARVLGSAEADRGGAACEVHVHGAVFVVAGSAALVRAIARRELGGPDELGAPRPLGVVERALWAYAVGAACERAGVEGEARVLLRVPWGEGVELAVDGGSVVVTAPRNLVMKAPPPRALSAWAERFAIDAPIVVARCALAREAVAALAVRDLVTVERGLALEIFAGEVALRAAPNAVVAEVASEYVRRDMALPDDASVELAVTLGTKRLSLREVLALSVGEIVALGRPLGGPFEVRAEGRMIGQGELVDVDGELAVRIVSLQQKAE